MIQKIDLFILLILSYLNQYQSQGIGNLTNQQQNHIYEQLIDWLSLQISNVKTTRPLPDKEILFLINEIAKFDPKKCIQSESCVDTWMGLYNYLSENIAEKNALLDYRLATNITETNEIALLKFAIILNTFRRETLFKAKFFYKHSNNWNPVLKRMLHLISMGALTKNPKEAAELERLKAKLSRTYSTAKVCDFGKCLQLEPGLTELFKHSRDYNILLVAWKSWRDQTGPKMRHDFTRVVHMMDTSIKESGFTDVPEAWMSDYEDADIENYLDGLFEKDVLPLYKELHVYVKRKLITFYGKFWNESDSNLIPAHLLGNMWGQSWTNIFDIVAPYPGKDILNIDEKLVKKGYTSLGIFKEAENFFKSIGLYEMTSTFWQESMLTRPNNRDVICHASATNFFNSYDFRIKMCTRIDTESFRTVHHEFGHIEYFMAYKDQPAIFRTGANQGFHEAIGDTISLSAMTPKHLKRIGLLESDRVTYEQDINILMKQALDKIVFLPFGYLMDKWRFEVFRGTINNTNYNRKWWEMREKYQGLKAPVFRSESDFDPASKYHIASFVPYNRYFVSHLLQFQFYKALCDMSRHSGALHRCDFYGSKKAGNVLKKVLKLGASQNWKKTLKLLTGGTHIKTNALEEYFQPLTSWLKKENQKHLGSI